MAFFVLCGIDYSLTSPAVCVYKGNSEDPWDPSKCEYHFLAQRKREIGTRNGLVGAEYPDFLSQEERYERISDWAMGIISKTGTKKVYMEDYAFAAAGRVFHIAENTGILKYKLWKNSIELQTFAPTEIKKLGTGKGNANKELMCAAFLAEVGLDIRHELEMSPNSWNPISDIVDAYYIAKLGYERETGKNLPPIPKKPKKKKKKVVVGSENNAA